MRAQKYYSYILVYLLLLFKAGFFFVESFGRYTNLFLLAITLFYVVKFRCKINRNALFFSLATLSLEFITFALTGFPEIEVFLSCFVDVLLSLSVVSAISVDAFKRYFSNINFAICIVSLICLVLYTINLPVYKFFPALFNSHGDCAYFVLLSIPREEFGFWSSYRVQGIYWEPGAFQFFVVLSAIIDFYDNRILDDRRFLRFVVCILALFFTFSTTGIICGVVITFLYFYRIKNKSIVPLTLFVGTIVFVVSYGIIDEDSYLYYSIFNKLDNLNRSYEYGASGDETADVRLDSFLYLLEEFVRSPVVGIGCSGKESLAKRGITMTTFTPLNLFAFYGFLMGLIHSVGLIKSMRLREKRIFEAVIVFSVLTLSTASEQLAFNPILMCFSMFGYTTMHRSVKNRSDARL